MYPRTVSLIVSNFAGALGNKRTSTTLRQYERKIRCMFEKVLTMHGVYRGCGQGRSKLDLDLFSHREGEK